MSIARATLSSLAELLSVRGDQVEDALASERLVKLSMDRRGFFKGIGAAAATVALAKGTGFSEFVDHWRTIEIGGDGHLQIVELTGQTRFSLSRRATQPGQMVMILRQDWVGGRAVEFPRSVRWPHGHAPRWSMEPLATNVVSINCDGRGNYYGVMNNLIRWGPAPRIAEGAPP